VYRFVNGLLEHPLETDLAERIELKNVFFTYRSKERDVLAVQDVSFTVDPGEFVCLVGPSGCGKTTILNMLAGFLQHTAGEILVNGAAGSGNKSDRGVVFQDFSQLFPWRTVRANVEFGLEMRGVDSKQRHDKAMEFLRMVKLDTFAESFPHQLSGGMQQRAAIARSLAYNPAVLLMDEPFAALDAMTRDEMQKMLTDVWSATKKSVVYITHNVSEAVYLGDKVVVLKAHPGSVKTIIGIDLPRYRDPLSPEFVDYQKQILQALA
jgi:NitT/TauT family transport system ATP-binding protein